MLRVAVCYRPAAFLPPDAASDRFELARIGWIAGERSPEPIALIDPIEGDDDYANGVKVYQHPLIAVAEDAQLWLVQDEFNTGARRAISTNDYQELSNWHVEAIRTQAAALSREQARALANATRKPEVSE